MQDTTLKGLTSAQVEENRRLYGANVLTPPAKEPLWKRFLSKFSDPLIIILLVAGVLSVGISCYEYWGLHSPEGAGVFFEPAGIFMAIILATGLSFYFEMKADKEFDLLNQVNDNDPVQVVRDGHVQEIPKKDVVAGDIAVLTTGCEIPADGTLLDATSLSVDESTLTGEPMAHKTTDPAAFDEEATFPSNTVMKGTNVMEGHGVMRVTSVGDATEAGKVYEAARIDNSVKTPLGEQLERLGTLISRFSYIIAALVVAGRMTMFFLSQTDLNWVNIFAEALQSVMIAVALIVVAVPEGLPMAVTLSLAYSMRRMLKTNNLVRKMHACETMGAITVICTDKTGTLTQNRMQVFKTEFYGDTPEDIIYEGMAVNSTAQLDTAGSGAKVLGNPTEGALLLWLDARGIDYRKPRQRDRVLAEVPFSTERKYMATEVERPDGKRILYVKGAPEIIFALCADKAGLTKEETDAVLLGYQNQAMRTLGFAYRELPDGQRGIEDSSLKTDGLKFIGLAAISDPVREDVPAAVRAVLNAGIQVKIVTGDTAATAKEIGRRTGLWNDAADSGLNITTGTEIAAMTDAELQERAGQLKIIARARPMDKKRLVEALQRRGEVVAVTGDGTNDAPALKAAHVGLSMGDGTSVAKESSDITIIDNSFSSIERAVMWGRSLYQNIQRFILFQMTVNVVACLIVLCGAFMGTESPLTVTQMLWVNLIMDTFAAMALASLPPSQAVMKDKPRSRKAFIITGDMWKSILGIGLVFVAILLALLWYLQHTGLCSLTQLLRLTITSGHELTPIELTVFFTIFVFMQFWNMFNARAFHTGRSAFHLKGANGFLTIAAIILIGQVLIVQAGGAFFNVTALTYQDWLIIVSGTAPVLLIGELTRLTHSRHR